MTLNLNLTVADERIRQATRIAMESNLPLAYVEELQGDTPEALRADVQRIMIEYNASEAVRTGQQPRLSLFTRAQMQNAEFVRAHEAEIKAAHAAGLLNIDG